MNIIIINLKIGLKITLFSMSRGMRVYRNGYYRRKWNQCREFESQKKKLFVFHFTLMFNGKGMNPSVLPKAVGKLKGRLVSLAWVRQLA